MSKRQLRFCFFSLLFIIILSCAPEKKVSIIHAPPAATIDDILSRIPEDINTLKAIVDIKILKDKKPFDFFNASLILRKPDQVHIRLYKLGILVRDMVVRGDEVRIIKGKEPQSLDRLVRFLYRTVLWWEGLSDGEFIERDDHYLIRTDSRAIKISKKTLLPVSQEIITDQGIFILSYDRPEDFNGLWYPSVIQTSIGDFDFHIKIRKIIINKNQY